MNGSARVALISGGNRGLGLETGRQLAAKGYKVVLGSRDPAAGAAAVKDLAASGHAAETVVLDVCDEKSAAAAVGTVIAGHARLDVLVNNAGILPGEVRLAAVAIDVFAEALAVNVTGALRLAQHAIPHMQAGGYGRVVNVSSMLAQLVDLGPGAGAYKVSKLALNAITIILAGELRGGPIKVNAASPGWVRTRMGGRHATRSVEEGADTIVWLATLADDGPTGGFFHDRKRIDW